MRAQHQPTVMHAVASAGVYGRVSQLCSVMDERYKLAVIVAMGKHFDSVVVDTGMAREKRAPSNRRECFQVWHQQCDAPAFCLLQLGS